MNNLKKCIFILILFLMVNVKAENLNYYLEMPSSSNVGRGETFTINSIVENKDNESYQLKSGNISLRWDDSFIELVAYSKMDIGSISFEETKRLSNKISLNFNLDENINGKKKLISFTFKVKANAQAKQTKIYEMDEDDKLKCFSDNNLYVCGESLYKEFNINVLKNNINLLSDIKIDGKTINNFNENTKTYNLLIDSKKESINIEAIKKDNYSSVSGDVGTKNISYGTSTFRINVTSESGITNVYTINVTRNDTRSSVNTLKDLKLSEGTISFKNNILDYNVTVKNEVSKIIITSSLEDDKSKYEVDYSNKEISLNEGLNKIQIKVIAENLNTRIYTLNIVRELSSNNSLKEIKINEDKIELEENKFNYEYTVENDIEKINVKIVASDSNAKINIEGDTNLIVGDNEFKIKVTAPNGNEVIYYLTVNRKDIASNVSLLDDIQISGYDLKFESDVKYYDLAINDEESLDIKIIKRDEKSSVDIEGNKNLINGSIIKITVKAEDNTITRYFINIQKEKSNILKIILIFLPLLIILSVIIWVIIRKETKNKKNFASLDKELNSNASLNESLSNKKEMVETDTLLKENETVDNQKELDDNIKQDKSILSEKEEDEEPSFEKRSVTINNEDKDDNKKAI